MENISISKKYEITNLGRKSNIQRLCEQITLNDNDVVLDIRECNIDYPATSMLLDYILELLSKMGGEKKIKILYDVCFEEIITLQYFVVGSSFLNITNKFQSLTDYQDAIKSKLLNNKITLIIAIMEAETIIKEYTYGI